MTEQVRYDELDRAIDSIISRGELTSTGDPGLDSLVRLASGLRGLPTPERKAQLREELFPKASRRLWPSLPAVPGLPRLRALPLAPRIAMAILFAGVVAAFAVLVASPFGERAAEEQAFGALPAPAGGGKGGGGPVIPGTSGTITYKLSPDLSLPTSALAYRLRPPEVTSESVQAIALRLGIDSPVAFVPGEEDGKDGGIPASYIVASEGRLFQMMEDGHFSFQNDTLSGDVKHAPPDAQASTEDETRAAVEAWLRLTGVTGDEQYRIQVSEPTNGSRDVIVTLPRPENQILDHPSIHLLVASDSEIAQVSGYWPSIDAESGYPLHTAEQLLVNLKNLRGEFNFLEPLGGKDQGPAFPDAQEDASVTVERVEVAYTLGRKEGGRPLLVPLFVVRGELEQDGVTFAFATWVPATGPTASPPQVPEPLAELIAVRDALPLPAGAGAEQMGDAGYEAGALITAYFVQDEPSAVAEFYGRELAAQGWQLEEPLPFKWAPEAVGAQFSLVSSFVKGDVRVVVLVGPNQKDPSRGATLLDVAVEARASEAVAAVARSLPLYPGATIQHFGFETESGLLSAYRVQDDPDAIVQFYRQELAAQGWQPEEPPVVELTTELGIDLAQYSTIKSFVKDDLRVAILVVVPGEEDPNYPATLFDVVVEPRS